MKWCINCGMGDPLPHDERIGQVIFNELRKDLNDSESKHEDQIVAGKLFNISDHDLKKIFFNRLWCNKCKMAGRQP